MKKIKTVMQNVMAALNTFGIEYDTNEIGFDVEKTLAEITANEEEIIDFKDDNFDDKFAEFVNQPHYATMCGKYWADNDQYVVIQLARRYVMDDKDWQEYACYCGCETPLEAQCNFGDPEPTYIMLTVKVSKGSICNFLNKVAKYCWQ